MSWQIGACATKRLLSSCQPLEIPGNVIQSSSLKKNHSARNSPGQQIELDGLWWKEDFKACAVINTTIRLEHHCHLFKQQLPSSLTPPIHIESSLALSHVCHLQVSHCIFSTLCALYVVLVNSQTSRGLL